MLSFIYLFIHSYFCLCLDLFIYAWIYAFIYIDVYFFHLCFYLKLHYYYFFIPAFNNAYLLTHAFIYFFYVFMYTFFLMKCKPIWFFCVGQHFLYKCSWLTLSCVEAGHSFLTQNRLCVYPSQPCFHDLWI